MARSTDISTENSDSSGSSNPASSSPTKQSSTRFVSQPGVPVTDASNLQSIMEDPGFGDHFTDHMVRATWTEGEGWHDPQLAGADSFVLHPGAGVFHYGQEIFEGLKAYRRDDDSIWLFRPEMNARRFQHSARRMSMAELPEDWFLDGVRSLVRADSSWVPPRDNEQSLYIRPFEFASELVIGVRPAKQYTFSVIATPVGAYYPAPVRLWLTPNYVRAAKGGTGAAKTGGNYAGSLIAAEEAAEHGCQQVLWLDAQEHRWVEECGTMNVMFITSEGELITPATTGSILEGVTRDSLLTLAKDHGLKPSERRIDVHELLKDVTAGRITEAFACGTAAVITPVVGFASPNADSEAGPDNQYTVADGEPGQQTLALRQHLLDIQYGLAPDPYGWTERVV